MQWHDPRPQADTAPNAVQLRQVASPPGPEPARFIRLGEALLQRAQYREAVAAFEQAGTCGGPRESRHFINLAFSYLCLNQPADTLRVCEQALRVLPDNSDMYRLRGDALRQLGRETEACVAFMTALWLGDFAFTAAESLLLPLVPDPDGSRLLARCDELPRAYANCTVVRGFRAIALSRVGRTDEAKALVDVERYVAQTAFTPPAEFGGIERFNALLAEEIAGNPGLRYTDTYGFHRTEQLNVTGARAFPALARFLQTAINNFAAAFPNCGLNSVMPPPPQEGFLRSAGNIVRGDESHRSHLHKFAYISGVYHVAVPLQTGGDDGRSGALVIGACEDFTGGYAPCWGRRYIKPVPGVATLFPSHIFHSVVATGSTQPRVAVPFDLGMIARRPAVAPPRFGYRWSPQWNCSATLTQA